jgi:hypothetical protein
MGRARRCRAVVLGASVAALGATGAGGGEALARPAANAASAPGSHGPRATVAHKHAVLRRHPRHKAAPTPARRSGKYVYEGVIGNTVATENEPNMACTGAGARLTRIAFAELNGPGSFKIWAQHPAAFNKTYTLTATPTTTITVSWTPPAERREAEEEAATHNGEVRNPHLQGQNDTTTVGKVCAAAPRPDAAIAEIGEATVTWELPAPVTSLAALTRHAPTNITPNEYSVSFEVQPDGTVPPFTQEVESMKAKQAEDR